MSLQEIVLCATAAAQDTRTTGSIAMHDIQKGSLLASFKQTNSAPHCTAVLESKGDQGGFVLAAQPEKAILNVYNFQKDQVVLKMILPEKLTSTTIDNRGDFCAGGTAQGRIYLWEIASGILFNAWDAHYRQVTALRFTPDGAALISGSEDSGVNVWSVSRLLDDVQQNDLPLPYCMLSDHTLPVTDIICGIGAFPKCRILTSALDHSVKLWDLSSRSLLTTFQFPRPISCLAWDATERLFFAASFDGSIHQVNLFRQTRNRTGGELLEAMGGAGSTDVIRIGEENAAEQRRRLLTVGHPVTALAISLTSSLLVVGTSTGVVQIYDIPSHQLLRNISNHKGLAVTFLHTMLKPPDLIGHVNLNVIRNNANDVKDAIPPKSISPFHRMKDSAAREAHDVLMTLSPENVNRQKMAVAYDTEEMLLDHAFFVGPTPPLTGSNVEGAVASPRVAELQAENVQLREQLGKAKALNDMMWDTVVHEALGKGKKSQSTDDGDTNEQRRKRSRS